MREIKFRAWIKDEKRMERSLDVCHCNCIDYSIDENTVERKQIGKECELMQYTGLKDKNGKEVYEGDVVKGEEFTGIVKWAGYSWQVHRQDADGEVEEYFMIYDYPFKVIGNIHENPEILKEVKT